MNEIEFLPFDEFDNEYWRKFDPKIWEQKKDQYLHHIVKCWGKMPNLDQVEALFIEEVVRDGYRIEKYEMRVSEMHYLPDDFLPVWLLIPDNPKTTPCPAMIIHHQHAGQYDLGAEEPAGEKGDPQQAFAVELVKQGYITVVFDALCFASRAEKAGERFTFTRLLMWGMTLNGRYCWDVSKVIDFLYTNPLIDKNRIGIMGHSLGGQMAIWAAVFDKRIKIVVSSCGFARIAGENSLIQHQINHNFALYLYDFLNVDLKMDMHEVLGLIHPRPMILSNGGKDLMFPIDGVAEIHSFIENLYSYYGNKDKITTIRHSEGHVLPDPARKQVYAFIEKWL
jgi:dienelactone hydrolase